MEFSYWEHRHWFENQDIVIVGAGLTGTLSAISIKKKFPNRRVTVIEAAPIPKGASTKNAGFACFATIGEILDDLSNSSEQKVIDTIRLRYTGLKLLKKLVVPSSSMAYAENGGCELFETALEYEQHVDNLDYVNSLIEEATGLTQCLIRAQSSECGISAANRLHHSTIYNKYEGSLNPVMLIKFLSHEARKLGVEFQFGMAINKYIVDNGKVHLDINGLEMVCRDVIFCTNAFAHTHFPQEDIVPARNMVLVSEPQKGMISGNFHCQKGYIYFRNIGKRLLIGGARNLDLSGETTSDFGFNPEIDTFLKDFALSKIGLHELTFPYKWSGIIATGQSKFPIIKQENAHIYTAVRMGGMGVAISSAVAQKVAEILV